MNTTLILAVGLLVVAGGVAYRAIRKDATAQKANKLSEVNQEAHSVEYEVYSDEFMEDLDNKAINALRKSGVPMQDEAEALSALKEIGHRIRSPKTYVATVRRLIDQTSTP